jgi:hypothetical protein
MAESEKAKADRLQKRREKQRIKREQTGDTPEAAAERHKTEKASDKDRLQQLGERTGVFG